MVARGRRTLINRDLERHSRALFALTMRAMDDAADDLSPSALRALLALDERGACKLAVLAGELRLSQSATSRLVDRLVENGLVDRAASPDSRREIRISATVDGEKITRRVLRLRQQAIDDVLRAMDADAAQQLLSGLAAFAAAASAHSDAG